METKYNSNFLSIWLTNPIAVTKEDIYSAVQKPILAHHQKDNLQKPLLKNIYK